MKKFKYKTNMNKQISAEKIILYTTLAGTTIKSFYDIYQQLQIKKIDPQYRYNLQQTLEQGLIGAGYGFVTGIGIAFLVNNLFADTYDSESPIQENEYLQDVLVSYEVDTCSEAHIKSQRVMNQVYSCFKGQLEAVPTLQGSSKKGTAIAGSSDIDIVARFKPNSFKTLKDMSCALYCLFKQSNDFDLKEVRQQKHSIGLLYQLGGQKFRIDIVPQRRQASNNDYSLYVSPKSSFEKPTYKKTNTKKHERFGYAGKSKKAITQLIKIHNEAYNLPLKGLLIERLVIGIMDTNHVPKKGFERLKFVLNKLGEWVSYRNIKDPANASNSLSNYLSNKQKHQLCCHFKQVVYDLETDSRNLRKYFPSFSN